MSTPSSGRWREGRPQSLNTPPPQQQQRQQLPAQTQPADRANASASPRPGSHSRTPSTTQNRVPLTNQAGNATGVGNATGAGNAWAAGDKNRAGAHAAVPIEEKTKAQMGEFDAEEMRAFLRRDDPPESAETNKGGSAPTKPGIMANGQDFWISLRKQITELEQGKR